MKIILDRKFVFILLSIVLSLFFIIKIPYIQTVDNVDYFTVHDNIESKIYDSIKKEFGNDEFYIIAYSLKDFFSFNNLETLKKITLELEDLEGVRRVTSLTNVASTKGDNNFFLVEPFLNYVPENKNELEKIRINAVSNPLYEKNLISKDGKTGAIVVFVNENNADPGFRKKIIGSTKQILKKYSAVTGEYFLAGWTITNFALSQYMKKDIFIFIPVTYFLIILCVYFFFKNVVLTLIAFLNISLCMGSTLGLFPLLGICLNNITVIVPPVVMALALCDTMHIFSYLNKNVLEKFKSKETAVVFVMKKLFLPCFLTSLTTAIGFASLYASDVPPIKDFAIISSAGMFFEFFFSFVFLPPVLVLFSEERVFQDKKKANT